MRKELQKQKIYKKSFSKQNNAKGKAGKFVWLGAAIVLIIAVALIYQFYFAYKPGFGDDDQARTAALAYTARLVENSSWQANQTRDLVFGGKISPEDALAKLKEYREHLEKTRAFYKTVLPVPTGMEGPAQSMVKAMNLYEKYLDKSEQYYRSEGKEGNYNELQKLASDTLWASMEVSVFFENSPVKANAIQGKVQINNQLYETPFKVYRGY